jgi:pSer/pThr/pTyr-binding forkhead associated (FHA) protein/tRNA A-37 threonylcarbamoyl transferase component Bud32
MPTLRITVNDETSEVNLAGGTLTAGRVPQCDLTLPVKEASREHFRIGSVKGGGWAVQDLKSTNGTFLNGERVKAARLDHQDIITIGPNCRVVFLDPPEPEVEELVEVIEVEDAPKPRKKKPSGPVVLKSRAQREREAKEEAIRKRAEARKAERAAVKKAAAETETGETESEPTEEIYPAEDAVEIDSEEKLQGLLADRSKFDAFLASGSKPVVFGKYQIVKRLSQGGMGVVFKAKHRKQGHHVALKVLRTEMVDENNIARFKQEAWAISAFDHPNIVKVRDLANHAGMHFIAMDFVDGQDLLALGLSHELTFWTVQEIIDKMADVLRLVHGRNIWHRDIKPQNILMDRKGEVKLIDFGIATVEREQDDATKTAEGLIMGTPAFLSPEQAARGKMGAIDGRADLYSLGAVMYYLLTGHRPFTGKSPLEVLHANMKKEPPPPRELEPLAPEGLCGICLHLLRKEPDDRIQSADELQQQLARWRKSADGKAELERHRKILKLRAAKRKRS